MKPLRKRIERAARRSSAQRQGGRVYSCAMRRAEAVGRPDAFRRTCSEQGSSAAQQPVRRGKAPGRSVRWGAKQRAWIRVSVEATEPRRYVESRGGDSWTMVDAGLERFAEL